MKLTKATRDIASSCLCRRVQALSRRVTNLYDDALRHAGVTGNQLTTLVAIERSTGLSPGELAELLGADKSTVSRTVARMARNGWLTTSKTGRLRSVALTPEGRTRIEAAHSCWRRAQESAAASLGENLVGAILGLDEATV